MPRATDISTSEFTGSPVQAAHVPENYRCPGSISDAEFGVGPTTNEVLSVLSAMERLMH